VSFPLDVAWRDASAGLLRKNHHHRCLSPRNFGVDSPAKPHWLRLPDEFWPRRDSERFDIDQ
jgi:hypothetical protein